MIDARPEYLARLAAAMPGQGDLVGAFGDFIRTADEREIVRMNAVHLAERLGKSQRDVVALLLHARKLGLATMEWQYVCPGCGEVVERLTSLTSGPSPVRGGGELDQ